MWKARSTHSVLSCLFTSMLIGCGDAPVEKEQPVRPVKIHTVGSLEPSAIREYPGTIRAYQTAEMGFEVPGKVLKFPVREGDTVEQGALLAHLDARDYEAELKVAQANLDKAIADQQRGENIFKENPGAISKDDLERNIRGTKVFEAKLEIAQKAVDDTELRAPFAGVVARKLVNDFANVPAKEPILILQDTSILEIEVAVPERDLVGRSGTAETKEQLTERLSPTVIVSSLPDREFPATIKEYATAADPITRTFPFKLTFDKPKDLNILPGMTARVRVVIDPESAWSVPASAVQSDSQEQPFVWKVDSTSNTVSKCEVKLGELTGDRLLLSSGVEKGDWVATSGAASLRDGMKVRKMAKSGEPSK